MKYPYERFLKHLLLQGRETAEITQAIHACGFVCNEDTFEDDLNLLKQDLCSSHPQVKAWIDGKRKSCPKGKAVEKAMDTSLVMTDKIAFEQTTLFKSGPLRRAIEALMLKELSVERVQMELEPRFGLPMNGGQLEFFKSFYWNSDDMGFAEWFCYIEMMGDSDREFFKEILMADMNRAIFLSGGIPQLGEADFLKVWLQKTQMILMESVDPMFNEKRIPPKDWVSCYSHMREHFLDAELRAKAEDQEGAAEKLKNVIELEDPRENLISMEEIEQAGGSVG